MEQLFGSRQWCSSPRGYWTIKYEHRRVGSDMQYRFYWNVWINAGGWYYNAFKLPIYLNGSNVETIQVKTYNSNEKGWNKSGTTGWHTVSNKTSGTTSFYAKIVDTGGYAQTGWKVCDTSPTYNLYVDPAKSEIGRISDFTIGNAINIPITKYSSNFRDQLIIKYGETVVKNISSVSPGANISFTNSELNNIYSLMRTTNSGSFLFTLTTYNGNTSVGSSQTSAKGTITNANPIFYSSNISYKDNNSLTNNVTGDNQLLVQNLSKLLVTISSASGNKGATINNYVISINGINRTITSPGTVDFGVINSGSDLTLNVKVTDSRGNTVSASKTVKFIAWSLPTAIISLKRKNNYENETYLKVDASYSSLNSKNKISINYQYKKTTESNFSSLKNLEDNKTITINNDKNCAWDYKIIIKDKFGTTTYNSILPKGNFILFVDTKKLSVGVNCFPKNGGTLEVNGEKISAFDIDKVYPVGSIYLTVSSSNPKDLFGGRWEKMCGGFLYGVVNAPSNGNGTGTYTNNHSLTVAQLPSHNHSCSTNGSHQHWGERPRWWYKEPERGNSGSIINANTTHAHDTYQPFGSYAGDHSHTIGNTGSGQGHSHNIPYIGVWVWKRIS